MREAYRRGASPHNLSLLQPFANACWRAAAFEWALYRDAATVRQLWGEAARALAEGFARRGAGFDPQPDQFVRALHFAIVARDADAFAMLAMTAPNLRDGALRGAQGFRNSRSHFHLAEGYAMVARSVVERKPGPARAAVESLEAARQENSCDWWERQFPDPLDAAWRASEHEAICLLLGAVARRLDEPREDEAREAARALAEEFARTVDEALRRLEKFTRHDPNHHPKLYLWLPGLALCALASSAGLPVDWLDERRQSQATGYGRLPLELLCGGPAS